MQWRGMGYSNDGVVNRNHDGMLQKKKANRKKKNSKTKRFDAIHRPLTKTLRKSNCDSWERERKSADIQIKTVIEKANRSVQTFSSL